MPSETARQQTKETIMKTEWKMETGLVCFTVRDDGRLIFASDFMTEDEAKNEAVPWQEEGGYDVEFSEED
jgi:hypothetical protein